MYSLSWFHTFASHQPAAQAAAELDAIQRLAPVDRFARVLDIACGNGRVARGLANRGYLVTGIDINEAALAEAAVSVPEGRFMQLDQRQLSTLDGTFDVALILWNSIGFGDRTEDARTLQDVAQRLRPGGLLLLDLYHPDWLERNQQTGHRDERGAIIDRTVRDGRCMHRIEYHTGEVDRIAFNVYLPSEMMSMLATAGFHVDPPMAWWRPEVEAGGEYARYQLRCAR